MLTNNGDQEEDYENDLNNEDSTMMTKEQRARNRIHAQASREKKRAYEAMLEQRVRMLHNIGSELRVIVEEFYVKFKISNPGVVGELVKNDRNGVPTAVCCSTMLCGNSYMHETVRQHNSKISGVHDKDNFPIPRGDEGFYPDLLEANTFQLNGKGKLNDRRERNRIHAKRTRFRKRMRLELNEHLAREMQVENRALVKYLFRFDLITDEKIRHYEAMDETFRSEVAQLQEYAGNDDQNGDAVEEAPPQDVDRDAANAMLGLVGTKSAPSETAVHSSHSTGGSGANKKQNYLDNVYSVSTVFPPVSSSRSMDANTVGKMLLTEMMEPSGLTSNKSFRDFEEASANNQILRIVAGDDGTTGRPHSVAVKSERAAPKKRGRPTLEDQARKRGKASSSMLPPDAFPNAWNATDAQKQHYMMALMQLQMQQQQQLIMQLFPGGVPGMPMPGMPMQMPGMQMPGMQMPGMQMQMPLHMLGIPQADSSSQGGNGAPNRNNNSAAEGHFSPYAGVGVKNPAPGNSAGYMMYGMPSTMQQPYPPMYGAFPGYPGVPSSAGLNTPAQDPVLAGSGPMLNNYAMNNFGPTHYPGVERFPSYPGPAMNSGGQTPVHYPGMSGYGAPVAQNPVTSNYLNSSVQGSYSGNRDTMNDRRHSGNSAGGSSVSNNAMTVPGISALFGNKSSPYRSSEVAPIPTSNGSADTNSKNNVRKDVNRNDVNFSVTL